MTGYTRIRQGDRARANRVFRALPIQIQREVSLAIEQNAQELAEAIRRRTPVRGGDLTASVRVERGQAARSNSRNASTAGNNADIAAQVIQGGGDTFYARFVEHGTVNHRAQPHFYPTYRQLLRKMRARLARAVNKAVRHVAALRTTP